MRGQSARRPAAPVVGGLAVMLLLWTAHGAGAQTADEFCSLRLRLDQLEQRNHKLEQTNKELLQAVRTLLQRSETGEYLNKKANEKRQLEDLKKRQDADKWAAVGSDLSLKASWKDGFSAQTPHQDFRFHVGGRIQLDWAWFYPDAHLQPLGWNDGADIRAFRFRMDGTAWEVIDWVAEFDFANGVIGTTQHAAPTDVYFTITQLPLVGNFRTGHFKEPFSLERYGISETNLTFMERSTGENAFDPVRNVGLMLFDAIWDQRITWAAGLFRTNSDNFSGNAFDYGDGEYAYTARLTFNPLYAQDGCCVFMFGGACSYRGLNPADTGLNGSNPSRARFAARAPVRVGSPLLVDTGSIVASHSQLFNLQSLLILGPFSWQSECFAAQVNDGRFGLLAPRVPRLLEPAFGGAYVQASYFLTGEHRNYDRKIAGIGRLQPFEQFYLVRGDDEHRPGARRVHYGLGAWEIAARYNYLNVGSPALGAYPGIKGVSGSAFPAVLTRGSEQDITLGLNWYLNPNFKVQWNYVHAWRNVPLSSGAGMVDAFAMRFQMQF